MRSTLLATLVSTILVGCAGPPAAGSDQRVEGCARPRIYVNPKIPDSAMDRMVRDGIAKIGCVVLVTASCRSHPFSW